MTEHLRQVILDAAEDAGLDFGDFRDDEELSVDNVVAAIAAGDVSEAEISEAFVNGMNRGLGR